MLLEVLVVGPELKSCVQPWLSGGSFQKIQIDCSLDDFGAHALDRPWVKQKESNRILPTSF